MATFGFDRDEQEVADEMRSQMKLAVVALTGLAEGMSGEEGEGLRTAMASFAWKQCEAYENAGFTRQEALMLTGAAMSQFNKTGNGGK